MKTTLLKKHWPRVVLAISAAALCVLVLAQTGGRRSKTPVAAAKSPAAAVATVAPDAVASRQPLAYYTGGIRKDLFGTPAAPVVQKAPDAVPILPPVDPSAATVDPFADYAYTGTAMIGNQPVALVENTKTKEGQFVHVGETFMGARVDRIADTGLTISLAGKTRVMAKNDDFKLTPLDKNAPITAAPAPAPAAPGAPGASGGGPMGGMIQRFMNATPDQREQMIQRFMSGGGGGRRGRGGGGGGGGGFGGGGGTN